MEKISSTATKLKNKTTAGPNKRYDSNPMPHPGCDFCAELGFISVDVPVGHPFFGELIPCPYYPIEHEIYNTYGLTPGERKLTWGEIADHNNVGLGVKAVKEVLERGSGLVYLHGGFGVAKTLILKIAVASWLRAQVENIRTGLESGKALKTFQAARYVFMEDIVDQLRASYDEDKPGAALETVMTKYKATALLAIDEVGVGATSEFSTKEQFFLIDNRYTRAIENQEPIITILSSNLSHSELPPRIADRITDGRCEVVELVGESYRLGASRDES